MTNEEKKAIEYLKRHIIPVYGSKGQIEYLLNDTILNLIEKQQKEIEDKKEEIYTIAKTNYILGQTDERSQWYKKINEKIEEYNKEQYLAGEHLVVQVLKELIGKEE